ncbi:hypothetical protein OIT41_20645 (plasmid) [Arthrobacter sp. YA7-1]|uniref:hypothetical protein n=1 Tax=Arthrobacter sp. YA7-1 TaxID=2987701 RepID=UPI002225CE20|nr:hypothetical protein [Arthrobacter sp. YA7-1]UYY83676.1 hypothetical protein OIT41_20645 [Arthrobacter sp. YA7-1]
MSAEASEQKPVVDRSDHHKHMDYVQAVINRLAGNSFLMKGWALTVSSALLGLAVSQNKPLLALVAAMPALAFWVQDTYFLRQERAFRAMFDDIAAKRIPGFEIRPTPYAKNQRWRIAWSISLSGFYGSIIVVSVLVWATLGLTTATATDKNGACTPLCVQPAKTPPAVGGCRGWESDSTVGSVAFGSGEGGAEVGCHLIEVVR